MPLISLTYFAVTNNKPAFAIESSKNLSSLSQKVYYQLLAIEEFMKVMDISFTRKFNLNENSIHKIIKKYSEIDNKWQYFIKTFQYKKIFKVYSARIEE